MDLQLFYRDTEQADTWMVKQESFLVNQDLGDSLDSVEVNIFYKEWHNLNIIVALHVPLKISYFAK